MRAWRSRQRAREFELVEFLAQRRTLLRTFGDPDARARILALVLDRLRQRELFAAATVSIRLPPDGGRSHAFFVDPRGKVTFYELDAVDAGATT